MSPMSLFVVVVVFLNVARTEGNCSQNNKNMNVVRLVKPWNENTECYTSCSVSITSFNYFPLCFSFTFDNDTFHKCLTGVCYHGCVITTVD